MSDDEIWFDRTFPPVYNRGVREGPEAFGPTERVVYLVGWFLFEMYGGPYAVYANHPIGSYTARIAEALEQIGAVRAARAMRAIDAAFPGGAPAADEATREQQLDALPTSADVLFTELERANEEPAPNGGGRLILGLLRIFATA